MNCTACNKPKNEWGPNCTSEVEDHEEIRISDDLAITPLAPHSEESWEVDLSQLLTKYGIRFELESGKTLKQALEQFFRRVIQAERQKVIEEIESLDETKDLIKYLEANYEVKLWINILDELKGRKGK